MTENPVKTHRFCFNRGDNSGESLTLTTKFIPNGDPGVVFTNQVLELQSYGNSACINLYGIAITPELLRQLANQLDAETIAAKALAGK
jgi:hypothetical protein